MSALITDTHATRDTFNSATFAAYALSSEQNLAAVIDHTILKPEATNKDVIKLCEEAAHHRFACAMVNPCWVPLAYSVLSGSGVPVGVVIGFPLGATTTASKRGEALEMAKLGAREVDMVLNIGMLRSGLYAQVDQDIRSVAEVVHDTGGILKVILETCLLSLEEKLRASLMATTAGADFLKTSTGFSSSGATAEDARTMLEAGANRIGASAGVKILSELARSHA
jgi:deoxyribose-phosphate aldolase